MICPNCYSTSLSGPYSAVSITSRQLMTLMECGHCESVFDAYERFGSEDDNQLPAVAA
jgi:hypothetical protein